MKSRVFDLGEKLLLAGLVLYVADKVFNPYEPKPVSAPSQPLAIIWTNPKL